MGEPVTVVAMWQANCDACGWHTPPSSPKHVVNEWAQLHREGCRARLASTDQETHNG